jgi:hypothetical protein
VSDNEKLHSRPDLPWWHAGNVTIGSKRKTKIKKSNSWSSYWMDDDSYDYFYDTTPVHTKIRIDGQTKSNAQVDIARAGRLAAVRRAVSNFVRILTNDDEITVSFSSGHDSYTDGKVVVISAEDKPEKFDMLVGTALHESAHCVFSQALFDLMKKHDIGSYATTSSEDVEKFLKECGVDEKLMEVDPDDPSLRSDDELWKHFNNFKNVINFLEDRRIDKEVFHRAPGYRPYYQSMYDNLWNAKDIAKALIRIVEMNEPTMKSYMFRLINLTNPATKYTLDRLPEFDKIFNIVDLNKIRRLSHEDGTVIAKDLIACSAEIYNIILRNIKEFEKGSDTSDQSEETDSMSDAGMPGGGEKSNLPNLDGGVPQFSDEEIEKKVAQELGGRSLGKADPNVEKLQEKQQDFLDGNTKKRKLSKKLSDVVSTMEESKTEVSTIKINGTEYPYLRVQKLTDSVKSLLKSHLLKEYDPAGVSKYDGWSQHSKQKDWVKTGCRLGQIIVDRIKVRHDRNETKFTRRPLGKIDRRLIYSLGVDNENVFFNKIIQDYQDSIIYLTLDCSSSMYGDKWKNSIILTTGLAYAAKKINNFDIVVNLRYGLDSIWSITMFDSRIDALTHFTKWMPLFHAAGYTPESIVYEIEEKFIKSLKTHNNNVYFITMTDGQPNYSPKLSGSIYSQTANSFDAWNEDSPAVRHCKKMMKSFKEMNINILSYFIGHAHTYGRDRDMDIFKKSYGREGVNVPLDNFSMISRSVNDLLISDCETR